MVSSKDIDPKVRFLVLLQDADMKLSRISKIIGKPLSTVYDWKQKLEDEVDFLEHQSKNFSSKIEDKKREAIIRQAQRSSKPVSSRKISVKRNVSRTTICDILKEGGLKYGKNKKKHELTLDEQANRVDFCKDMLKYRGSKIKRTFFSDEMGIRLSELSNSAKTWIPAGRKKVKTENITQDVKLNCWGGISYNGATSLHIYKTNMTNDLYQDILEEHAMEIEEPYANKKVYFQQDNHPSHNNVEILDDHPNIELLQFPTYSPDLNPIENMWAALKYRVACDAPKTEAALIRSLEAHWEDLTKLENLRPYLQTLEGRFLECIEKDGERLPH